MMVGNHYYSEADMMRMQRNAEERVREMQQRAKQTAKEMGEEIPPMPSFASSNRNWRANPNGRRGQNQNANRNSGGNQSNRPRPEEPEEQRETHQETPQRESAIPSQELPAPDATTLIEDMIGKLGLESDTLLIIGLILILINQKADNTVILALAYLLF